MKWCLRLAVALASSIFLLSAAHAASAIEPRIRIMLNAERAANDAPGTDSIASLRALAGLALDASGRTRTGALEFSLPEGTTAGDVTAALRRLRADRSVLWAESVSAAPAVKSQRKNVSTLRGRKLMVKLAADATVAPDWTALLPRFSNRIGADLAVERQIGDVWVLSLAGDVSEDLLDDLAEALQADPAVQFADGVHHASVKRVPDNPLYVQQWSLSDPVGGINAPAAWDLQTGSASVTVAVIDTGILPHPALAGRVLPGYDFITDVQTANDGNGRDSDASDPGDATDTGECPSGGPGRDSSWHGTFVSGIIAANSDSGIGIAGVDWKAKILPVRALGRCGGSFDDILAAILWAAGIPVAGAPPNVNPARVINMSLAGSGTCPQAVQSAIDFAMTQGAIVTVAAGNEGDDASLFSPASCSGVVTVGASTRQGDRTSYSNFGRRVDLSAPGGGGVVADWILSLSNDGKRSPGNPAYASEVGTSFSAPHVAGTVSLMLARNANLTPARVLDILTGTVRPFAPGSACAASPQCGVGLLNAGLALASTIPASASAPAGTVPVIEYYRADKDHYFMSANAAEQAGVDRNLSLVFQRTGHVFYAWPDAASAPAAAQPVCRFYASLGGLIDSHFYTASASECQFVQTHYPGVWLLEDPASFYVLVPDAAGRCPVNTLPVYRFFDNRRDANHRHTVDLTVRRAMTNRAWVPEGTGPNSVAFCSPV